MPGRNWFFKTLSVDHEIAHFDLTLMPKTKMKHYEDLPFKIETIPHFHDHDKGAVIWLCEFPPFGGSRLVVTKRGEDFSQRRLMP
jgi:hypothetical protein